MLVERRKSLGRNGEISQVSQCFQQIVEEWIVPEGVTNYLEEFVYVMYGYVREGNYLSEGNHFRRKFYSEGKIFWGGNYPRGQLFGEGAIFLGSNYPRGQLSRGAIIWGAIIQGAIIWGAIIRGAIFLESNCPRTVRETSVNAVRTKMLKNMVGEDEASSARSKVDLSCLESCRDSLFTHIQRSNYHLACYKRAASPMFERLKPFEDQGWKMSEEGYTEPLWSKGPVLPTTLVDILDCADIDAEVEDIEDILFCYCYFCYDVYLVFRFEIGIIWWIQIYLCLSPLLFKSEFNFF